MAKKSKAKSYEFSNSDPPSKLLVVIQAKNEGQKEVLRTIAKNKITLIYGPPGGGKTYLSVGWALQEMMQGRCNRIILTRPAIQAGGEDLGYLPGNIDEKMEPYIMPMLDVLMDFLSYDDLKRLIEEKKIMVIPLAYLRGRTFKNSYVVLDEAQNATISQFHLLLTRLGENSKIIAAGDLNQSDLTSVDKHGLADALIKLRGVPDVGTCEIGGQYCVREKLVTIIDKIYTADKNLDLAPLPSFDTDLESDLDEVEEGIEYEYEYEEYEEYDEYDDKQDE